MHAILQLRRGIHKKTIALYSNPSASIVVNGSLSEPLALQHGTRQGRPLSPSLFLLVLEPLLTDIKANEKIKGININSTQTKLAAYADDILIVTEQPKSSIRALIDTIEIYSRHSGCKLNKDKSECKPLNIHTTKDTLGGSGLTWQTGFIKYLGIYFGNNLINTLAHNENILLGKIKKLLETWSPKFITWWGRVETIKMMITPMINYLLSMLPLLLTDDFHRKIDKMITNFLWRGKKACIAIKKLRLDKKQGGLNLADFRTYQTAFIAKQGTCWRPPPPQRLHTSLATNRKSHTKQPKPYGVADSQ